MYCSCCPHSCIIVCWMIPLIVIDFFTHFNVPAILFHFCFCLHYSFIILFFFVSSARSLFVICLIIGGMLKIRCRRHSVLQNCRFHIGFHESNLLSTLSRWPPSNLDQKLELCGAKTFKGLPETDTSPWSVRYSCLRSLLLIYLQEYHQHQIGISTARGS